MKKRGKKLLIIGFICLNYLCLSSCNNSTTEEDIYEPSYDNYMESYHIANKLNDTESNYTDVIMFQGKLTATDDKNSCLKIFDTQLNLVDTIGCMGNGKLQFIKPKSLDIDSNGNLYILDYGNDRIQILNSNYEYVKEVKLGFLEGTQYQVDNVDFIVTNDGKKAYISGSNSDPNLYYIDLETGEYQIILKLSQGYFAKEDNIIYYVELGECIQEEDNFSVGSGKNYFYTMNGSEVESKVRLADLLSVRGAMIKDKQLVLGSWRVLAGSKSKGGSLIHTFNINGEYINTLFGNQLTDDMFEKEPYPENEDIFIFNIEQGQNDSILALYARDGFDNLDKGTSIMVLEPN